MVDVSRMSEEDKARVAEVIRLANLDRVNTMVKPVTARRSFYTNYGKRCIDLVAASAALLVLAPVNLLLAGAAFLDVGSPILFRQTRIGKDEKPFFIYKFRNMTNAVDSHGVLLPPAERVTKWGKFVRKTSLDELLNFVSIFKGDMSLIGPRPLLASYTQRFNNRDRQRYAVRPGLECPPYRKLGHGMDWQERLENDIWYVENCSFATDLLLTFRMVQLVFNRKATAVRSEGKFGGFLGYEEDGTVITTRNVPDKYWKKFCEKYNRTSEESSVV